MANWSDVMEQSGEERGLGGLARARACARACDCVCDDKQQPSNLSQEGRND